MSASKKKIVIDPKMSCFDGISFFPKKVARAKEILARTDLSKLYKTADQPAK